MGWMEPHLVHRYARLHSAPPPRYRHRSNLSGLWYSIDTAGCIALLDQHKDWRLGKKSRLHGVGLTLLLVVTTLIIVIQHN